MVPTSKQFSSKSLNLGWIPYWNLSPLKQELLKIEKSQINWHSGNPTSVNKWLRDGKVDIAPCSSVCLLKEETHEMAFPLGISSTGSVGSVYLGIHKDSADLVEYIKTRQYHLSEIILQAMTKHAKDMRKATDFIFKATASLPAARPNMVPLISLTPASATSVMLTRLLHRLWFGNISFRAFNSSKDSTPIAPPNSMRRPMELLIGDEALIRRDSFYKIIDLGSAWHNITHLPFVFAVWQAAGKSIDPYWRKQITDAASIAEARMKVEPSVYLPDNPLLTSKGHAVDLAAYWKNLSYKLDAQHLKGLLLFLCLSRHLTGIQPSEKITAKLMRWELREQTLETLQ